MESLTLVQKFAVWALPVLFAITMHEAAHGWMAKQLGDKTALMLGRVSLNPVRHIDPIGTVLVPTLLLFLGGFLFGWAKPVPVTWENLKNPRKDMIWVAAAGPLSNLLMALFWLGVMALGSALYENAPDLAQFAIYTGFAGIQINIVLAVLNLLPLPPLDGGRITTGLLPGPLAWRYAKIEPYGLFILLGLLVTGVLGGMIGPIISFLVRSLLSLLG